MNTDFSDLVRPRDDTQVAPIMQPGSDRWLEVMDEERDYPPLDDDAHEEVEE